MSEISLLVFGCGVSFTALAGAYVFIRESFTDSSRLPEQRERARREKRLRDAA